MDLQFIAFCGAPYVGKRSIIKKLAELAPSTELSCESDPDEANLNVCVEMKLNHRELRLVTRSGVSFSPDKTIMHILQDANIIVYVMEPCFPDGNSVNFTNDYYAQQFDLYVRQSINTKKHWNDIPWIFVLNKTDIASCLPPVINRIPNTHKNNIIHCIAINGAGIPELWKDITKLL